jgi:hypothetical protein
MATKNDLDFVFFVNLQLRLGIRDSKNTLGEALLPEVCIGYVLLTVENREIR